MAMQTAAASLTRPALFPAHYMWYVLVCVLDLVLTNTVINYYGAREVNGIAHHAIELMGFWGLIALKVATMVVVITVCETVGRKRERLGLKVAEWAVALSALPVVATVTQIALRAV